MGGNGEGREREGRDGRERGGGEGKEWEGREGREREGEGRSHRLESTGGGE